MSDGGAAAGTAYHACPYYPYMYPHPGMFHARISPPSTTARGGAARSTCASRNPSRAMSPGGKENEPLKNKRGRPIKRKKRAYHRARAEVPAVCTPHVQIVHIYRREHEIQLLHGRCTARAVQSARDRLLYLIF